MSVFRSSQIGLDWGSSIVAKVVATNSYGDSISSAQGQGAILMTNPGVPQGLLEDFS